MSQPAPTSDNLNVAAEIATIVAGLATLLGVPETRIGKAIGVAL